VKACPSNHPAPTRLCATRTSGTDQSVLPNTHQPPALEGHQMSCVIPSVAADHAVQPIAVAVDLCRPGSSIPAATHRSPVRHSQRGSWWMACALPISGIRNLFEV